MLAHRPSHFANHSGRYYNYTKAHRYFWDTYSFRNASERQEFAQFSSNPQQYRLSPRRQRLHDQVFIQWKRYTKLGEIHSLRYSNKSSTPLHNLLQISKVLHWIRHLIEIDFWWKTLRNCLLNLENIYFVKTSETLWIIQITKRNRKTQRSQIERVDLMKNRPLIPYT